MSLYKEGRLRQPVAAWCVRRGLHPVYEVHLSGCCDIVAPLWGDRLTRRIPTILEIHAVELKLTDIAGVLGQCSSNKVWVSHVWAAMPEETIGRMRPATFRKFIAAGVGLLGVGDFDAVRIVIEAPTSELPEFAASRLRNTLWRRRTGRVHRDARMPATPAGGTP